MNYAAFFGFIVVMGKKHHAQNKIINDNSIASDAPSYINLIKNKSFLISFAITGLFLLIVILTLPIRYEVNDDFTMISILSGASGFTSSPDAMFINPVLSYFLYILYKISPFFPWYGIFLYTIYYLGWTLIISVIFRSNNGISFLLAVPILFYSFLYHSSVITFTSASLYLSFGVYLCLIEYFIRNEAPLNNAKVYFIFLALCFYLSFLLRWALVLYSLFLFFPMVVFMKFQQFKKILPIIITLGLVICINIAGIYLVSLNNQAFNKYDELRHKFFDTPGGQLYNSITELAMSKVGWSLEDYHAFKDLWLIYDTNTFNNQNLRSFITDNDIQKDKELYIINVINKLKLSYNEDKLLSTLLILSISSIFIINLNRLMLLNKADWLKITISLGLIIISIIFLMYYRFEKRVYGPLYIYLISLSFLFSNSMTNLKHKIFHNRYLRYFVISTTGAFMAFALLIVYVKTIDLFQGLELSEKSKITINQSFNFIQAQNYIKDPIVIQLDPRMEYGLGTERINPLKEYNDFPSIRAFPSGWLINSKYYDMALKDLGLGNGYEFLKWLIDRKDVFLFLDVHNIQEMYGVIYLWKSYYLRHINAGRKLDFIPVYDLRNKDGFGPIFFQIRSLNL